MLQLTHQIFKPVFRVFFFIAVSLLLANCGSSTETNPDSDQNNTAQTQTLSGTAAMGAAIVGTIFVTDSNGIQVSITINQDGSYSIDVTGMAAPFIISAVPADSSQDTQYSYAAQANITVNVSPLTTLAVWLANNQLDLSALESNWQTQSSNLTAQDIANTLEIVNANFSDQFALQELNATNYDFFSTAFDANGSGVDAFLDLLAISIDMTGGNLTVDYSGSSLTFDVNIANNGSDTGDNPGGDTDADTDTESDTGVVVPPWLVGVNLAGAEFGGELPGTEGFHYTYSQPNIAYFMEKGMNVFRVPFRWERLQKTLYSPLDPDEVEGLDSIVEEIIDAGGWVILDPHNSARWHGDIIGTTAVPTDAFADFWSQMSLHYSNERIIYGLVNEPHNMGTELWLENANVAIAAIRSGGAENLILVPGNGWSGAHSWGASWYGTSNAEVMLGVVDSADNYAFEVHQYLDSDSSGSSELCVSETIGSERLVSFTNWLVENGKRALLGEFGAARNDTCYAALDNLLAHLAENEGPWIGWTYWAAGPWWGEYLFTLEPSGGVDRPQMSIIEGYL